MAVLCLCFFASAAVAQQITVPAHRLLQWDIDNNPFGSKKSSFSLIGQPLGTEGKFGRRVATVRFADLAQREMQETVEETLLGGLVIILPKKLEHVSKEELAQWTLIERWLWSGTFDAPIYFIFETEDIENILADMASADTSDAYQFSVSIPEPKPKANVTLTNIQGFLDGHNPESGDDIAPSSIGIVAHYDTFAAAPDLAFGADANGSGVVALLELARLFGSLFSTFQTRGLVNMIFLLTTGSAFNYLGADKWASEQAEDDVIQSLDFVLCLDSIGHGNELYFHASKKQKDERISGIYNAFLQSAKRFNTPLTYVHNKINVSDLEHLDWEHQAFALQRVTAATISSRSSPTSEFQSSSLFDRNIHLDTLKNNTRLIAEALAQLVYVDVALDQSNLFEGVNSFHPEFVEATADYLAATPRMAAYLDAKAPVKHELHQILKRATSETVDLDFPMNGEEDFRQFLFFGSTGGTMVISRVKHISFEVYLLGSVLLYLLGLSFVLKFVLREDEWMKNK